MPDTTGPTEIEALRHLLDSLPIYATKIGYRFDSTDAERAFADAVFEVGRCWIELRAGLEVMP